MVLVDITSEYMPFCYSSQDSRDVAAFGAVLKVVNGGHSTLSHSCFNRLLTVMFPELIGHQLKSEGLMVLSFARHGSGFPAPCAFL
jgi:hypothetical protein